MLAGEVPFQGSTSELIYQHQLVSPPVDKLTDVPKPVIALLEVLLEKDPARRFQTPIELLQAIPRVTAALSSGRSVTADQWRSGADEVATTPKQPIRGLRRLLSGTRTRALRWLLASIVSVGGLVFAWFFFSGHGRRFFDRRAAETMAIEKSIAVLPFENISANKDDAYFADGVQDEILNNLAKIAQLRVISRISVMQYRADTKPDLRQIANALGVGSVLEGTVRRDGNRVRVSTELVDARNDHTIWADSYDRNLTDIFAIQSEIAQTIAGKLAAALSPEEKKWIEAKPTDNLEAYDLYLQATQLIANARVISYIGDIEKPLRDAIKLLEQAVQHDPKFALAYCEAVSAHDMLYNIYDQTSERRTLGDLAIANALVLQPDLPEVHLAYAFHLYRTYREYDRARVQLAIAKRGMPNNAAAIELGAFMDRRQGNFEKAIQELEEASTLDPRNPFPLKEVAALLSVLRRFPAAEQAYNRAIELAPDQPMLKVLRAHISFWKTGIDTPLRAAVATLPGSMGDDRNILSLRLSIALSDRDWQTAREIIKQMKDGQDEGEFGYAGFPVPVGCYFILIARLQGNPPSVDPSFVQAREELNQIAQRSPGVAPLISTLAVVDALLGRNKEAVVEAKHAVEMLPVSKDAVDGPTMLTNLAIVYAWTGQEDLAIATLAPLVKMPCGPFYGQLKLDPLWDPLRNDPRFDQLLADLAPR